MFKEGLVGVVNICCVVIETKSQDPKAEGDLAELTGAEKSI